MFLQSILNYYTPQAKTVRRIKREFKRVNRPTTKGRKVYKDVSFMALNKGNNHTGAFNVVVHEDGKAELTMHVCYPHNNFKVERYVFKDMRFILHNIQNSSFI